MKALLKSLTEAFGPSGYEKNIREIVAKEVEPLADEVRVDALGNLIVRKGRAGRNGRRVMLAAHLDEIGLMVSHVDENGFVRFSGIGYLFATQVVGSRVRFLNGASGVIGIENQFEERPSRPSPDKFFIDVGAAGRSDCPVKVGDVAAFERSFLDLGGRLVAKSMDNRVGVLMAVEALRRLGSGPNEVTAVFTVQEEVGSRGAGPAAFGLDPEIGLALEVTPATDTPKSTARNKIVLGKGPAIKVKDAGMIADPRVVDWMRRAAEKARIPYQLEVLEGGSTDARSIQLNRGGALAGALSVPVRYVHSSSEMIDFDDLQNSIKLLVALLRSPIQL
ncbi:MAG: M42 family metallopeptidase [Chloroflexota bacterium]